MGVVASSPENVLYTSGTTIITHLPIRDRLALNLIPAHGEPTLCVCFNEESLTREESWVKDIRIYHEFETLPTELLAQVIRERGLEGGPLGIDLGYLRQSYLEQLQHQLPTTRILPCDDLFATVRQHKAPGEADRISEAARKARSALATAVASARHPQSERLLFIALHQCLLDQGLDGAIVTVATGNAIANTVHRPRSSPASAEEWFYLGARVNDDGYCAQVGCMAHVEGAGGPGLDEYSRLFMARQEILNDLKAGMSTRELHFLIAGSLERQGLHFVDHGATAYGFGLGSREQPVVSPSSDGFVTLGTTLVLDLTCMSDSGTFRISDTVIVQEDGARIPYPLASQPLTLSF